MHFYSSLESHPTNFIIIAPVIHQVNMASTRGVNNNKGVGKLNRKSLLPKKICEDILGENMYKKHYQNTRQNRRPLCITYTAGRYSCRAPSSKRSGRRCAKSLLPSSEHCSRYSAKLRDKGMGSDREEGEARKPSLCK
jgi:hypothetical protein